MNVLYLVVSYPTCTRKLILVAEIKGIRRKEEKKPGKSPEERLKNYKAAGYIRDVLKVTDLTAQEAWTAADDSEGCRAQRSTANYTF